MFVRVKTDIMVGNKTIKKGRTAEATKNEGRSLILRGYAEEVDKLDDADKPEETSEEVGEPTANPDLPKKWKTVIAIDESGNDVTVDDLTVPKLKEWLDDNAVEYKSSMRSDNLKDLVEAEFNKLNEAK